MNEAEAHGAAGEARPRVREAGKVVEGVSQSLTDAAYLALEERIATLRLKPGEVLSESTLSASLGIGRTPVREALQRLAREGMVTVLPRRGILVSEFNVRSHLRMLEVRREIERLMARSAALRATEAEREGFAETARQMLEAAENGDDIGFMRLDQAFNRLVSQAARNEYATMVISLMAGLSRRFWFMQHQRGDNGLAAVAECHTEVANAIVSRFPDAAAAASDALIDHIESVTRAAVDW